MNRRDFMNWMGVGALASSLPVAIAACQSDTASAPPAAPADDPATADTAPRADGFAPVGTVADLDADGFVADSNFQGTQVVVVRNPADAASLIAVNSLCTHQGCTVDWEGGAFACPCHGSSFNPDGTVATGPATAALDTYTAKIEGDLVLVKV